MTNQEPNQKPALKKVQAEFENWRKTRKSRGFIPEALWGAAISLAGPYSLHQISKGLRLNHRTVGTGGCFGQRNFRGSRPNHLY